VKRKIIQITSCGVPSVPGSFSEMLFTLYALCDDGTVFRLWDNRPDNWKRVVPIPQDDTTEVKP